MPMLEGRLQDMTLHECAKCFGLWINTATFERICRDAEHQSSLLGQASPSAALQATTSVRYVPCPECHKLMHRVNFANCSGVVVDLCRQHGSWFEANELQQIVAFIRAGGLDRARERDKRQWAAERRLLEAAKREHQAQISGLNSSSPDFVSHDLLTTVVCAAGKLSSLWRNR
jgi:Zn-finger nucleic acid-binding protein